MKALEVMEQVYVFIMDIFISAGQGKYTVNIVLDLGLVVVSPVSAIQELCGIGHSRATPVAPAGKVPDSRRPPERRDVAVHEGADKVPLKAAGITWLGT